MLGHFDQFHNTLYPDSKSYSRSRLAVKILHQPVITSAAGDGRLCTDLAADKFKSGFVVVVQSTYQVGIDLIGYAGIVKQRCQFFKICIAGITEIVNQFW